MFLQSYFDYRLNYNIISCSIWVKKLCACKAPLGVTEPAQVTLWNEVSFTFNVDI